MIQLENDYDIAFHKSCAPMSDSGQTGVTAARGVISTSHLSLFLGWYGHEGRQQSIATPWIDPHLLRNFLSPAINCLIHASFSHTERSSTHFHLPPPPLVCVRMRVMVQIQSSRTLNGRPPILHLSPTRVAGDERGGVCTIQHNLT